MSRAIERMTSAEARRLLLGGQGLLDDPRAKVTPRLLHARVEALGLVQVDSINVVARAHELTMMARLDGYRPGMLVPLLEDTRDLFEHWTHDASIVPSRWFGHWRHRFQRDLEGHFASKWWRERLGARPETTAKKVLKRIAREGPLSAGDLDADNDAKKSGWWEWSPQKSALEYLWRTGRVLVTKRVSFTKIYDLTERVLLHHAALPKSEHDEHLDWAMSAALDRLGSGTATELARYFNAVPIAEARRWTQAKLKRGELVEIALESQTGPVTRAFAWPDHRERLAALSEPLERARLLSPFDPIVRDRARALRLFGFDYRFEAYTPAPKRKYGYYVLPVLRGDRLVGRADLKLDREAGVLRLQGKWWEPRLKPPSGAFEEAFERLAGQLGAKT